MDDVAYTVYRMLFTKGGNFIEAPSAILIDNHSLFWKDAEDLVFQCFLFFVNVHIVKLVDKKYGKYQWK